MSGEGHAKVSGLGEVLGFPSARQEPERRSQCKYLQFRGWRKRLQIDLSQPGGLLWKVTIPSPLFDPSPQDGLKLAEDDSREPMLQRSGAMNDEWS